MPSDYLRELLYEPPVQEPSTGEVIGEHRAILAQLEAMSDEQYAASIVNDPWPGASPATRAQAIEQNQRSIEELEHARANV